VLIDPISVKHYAGIYLNIILENNRLSRFESAVFKAPLYRPNVFTTFLLNTIVITGSNYTKIIKTKVDMIVYSYCINFVFTFLTLDPIDCLSDPCHLAWLLKSSNSSELLDHIQAKGICSTKTGSPFSVLSSFDFSKNCPCSFNYWLVKTGYFKVEANNIFWSFSIIAICFGWVINNYIKFKWRFVFFPYWVERIVFFGSGKYKNLYVFFKHVGLESWLRNSSILALFKFLSFALIRLKFIPKLREKNSESNSIGFRPTFYAN